MFLKAGRPIHAVRDVSLSVQAGETLSIVGESGCGKSSLAKIIVGLSRQDSGSIIVDGCERPPAGREGLELRRKVQHVFQDPYSSLSPKRTIGQTLAEPIINFRLLAGAQSIERRVLELLDKVGLPSSAADRYPHEFSGGQRQRIAIARALAPSPSLMVCDEAVSALDVSVKAQIVNLLLELQRSDGLTVIFISHDLGIVDYITDTVAVMYLGRVVELGTRQSVLHKPSHPYTRALLSANPVPDPMATRKRIVLKGDVPSPASQLPGCAFSGRCPAAQERCFTEQPTLQHRDTQAAEVACHFPIVEAVDAR